MTYEELIRTEEYCLSKTQIELFNKVLDYMTDNKESYQMIFERKGVPIETINQALMGDFDGSLSDLIKVSLCIGYVPVITFIPTEKYLEEQL